jgi:hypothetical protein
MAGDAGDGVHRRHQHHRSASGRQVVVQGLEGEERGGEVDVELSLPGGRGEFVGRPDVDGERVADQAADRAELVASAGQDLGPGVGGGDVTPDRDRAARDLLAGVDVHLDDGVAVGEQPLGARRTDSGGGTGHHDHAHAAVPSNDERVLS